MEDIRLRDREERETELINAQLKKIVESNDTESLKSGVEDLDIPEISVLPSLDDILAQDDPINLLDSDLREDIDSVLCVDDDLQSIISNSSSFSRPAASFIPGGGDIKTNKVLYGEIVKCSPLSLMGGVCNNRNDRATALCVKEKAVVIGFQSGRIGIMSADGQTHTQINTGKVGNGSGPVTSLSASDGILVASYSAGAVHVWDSETGAHLQKVEVKVPGSTVIKVVIIDRTHFLYVVSQGSVFEVHLTKKLTMRSSQSTCLFSGSHGEVLDIQRLVVSPNHPYHPLCVVGLCSFRQVMLISLKPYPNVKHSIKLWGDATTLPIIKWYYHPADCPTPKLVVGRASRFVMYSLHVDSLGQVFLRKIKSCSLEFRLISVFWFNTNTVGVLDSTEKLHLIDVGSLSRLQTVASVPDIGLCYNTAFYRSLTTGGNVSKAMHVASQFACYNSIVSYPGATWILGARDILKIVSNPWRQRIVDLQRDMHFEGALDLALTFYAGKGKGVSSLVFRDMARVRDSCLNLIFDIFSVYLEETQQDLGQLAIALDRCISACVRTDNTQLIYDEIYLLISKIPAVQRTFFEALEPYVFNNRIRSLNPVLMKELLEYFQRTGKLQSFEQCILHLDPHNLDIHNTLLLCREYDLYEGTLYIYNACLHDYTTPLQELLEILGPQLLYGDTKHKQVGYVVLMYISNCLVGSVPEEDPDEVTRIQNLVFNSVFCRHSGEEKEEEVETDYPFVKMMLDLDTREFLNVMSVSFSHGECLPIQQIVIDILLHVMVEEGDSYTPLQIGALFTFLAREKVHHSFYLDQKYLDQALDCLATNDLYGHEEREQALLELVLSVGVEGFNECRLLELSERAQFYQVCEVIYEKRGEFDKVLFCYWSDTSRTDKVFSFIYHIMEGGYSEEEKIKIRDTCVKNIDKLISINNEDTATLILKVFSEDLEKIVEMLKDKSRDLYSLLQCVFDISKAGDEGGGEVVNFQIHHLYISLMAEYNPEFVCPYLRVATGYKVDTILEMCLIANLKDAAAFLYERKGDLSDAFKLYYDVLRDRISEGQLVFIEETLTKIIGFCQRNSDQLSPADKESYWFSLVDLLLSLEESTDCVELQESLIDNMLGFVSSSKVLDKLIRSSSSKAFRTYGDIKRVVGNMLDTLMYEEVLLSSTKRIVQHDIFSALRRDRTSLLRGRNVADVTCVVCCHMITASEPASAFLVFACAHTCHTRCVEHQQVKYCVLCESERAVTGREVITTRVLTGVGERGGEFEGWRARLEERRKLRRGPDRLDLLHELWGDEGEISEEEESEEEDSERWQGGAGTASSYQADNMDSFMSSRSIPDTPPTYRSPPPTSPHTVSSRSQRKFGFGRDRKQPSSSPKLTTSNPFGEDDQSSDTNPFASNPTNPFDDDSATNPFAVDDSLNPFGDDDEI